MTKLATIRPEKPQDSDEVRVVNRRAFGRSKEAALVDVLRDATRAISMVASLDGLIVGHILFTPVQVDEASPVIPAIGLAAMAVLPEYQRLGVGSQLVRAGLDACQAAGYRFVVVLGHPHYYPRFGFVPGSTVGLHCEYSVPPEVFMVRELQAGTLAQIRGVVRYRAEFGKP